MNMRGLPAIQYYVTGGQIDDIYQNLFGREADAGGKAYYEDLLGNASMADAIAIISGGAARGSADDIAQQDISDTSDYGTVTDYIVNQAYEDTLDRGVDPGGYDYYTQAIQSGMDPTLLDDQLARSNEAVSNLGTDKAQQAWEDATAFQNWNQMGIDYPGVYDLYSELRGPTGYISQEELQSYQNIFGNEISPEERDAFFRGAVASGEITEDELSKFLDTAGGTDTTGTTTTTTKTPVVTAPPVRATNQVTYPSTSIMGLPAISMPQFLPVGGLATRATKPYDAGSVLQGPTGLFRPVTTGAPPTAEEVTATEGMAEGGMAKATPADLGSKFDVESFKDKEGRLVGGYSRPIRDEFGVITGYDYRPYESDVVFGEELRSREAARQMTPEERARALLNMQVMSGRTGVSPIRGGLQGIEVRGPASRATPRYYPFAEGGLANAAQNLARRGRGGDSMLVHMAPEEVSGLRALARAQGNDLTINPNTGLPEAFSLKKLFRAASFVLPFIPIPGLFGMSSLLTRSILSGVAAGASAKGKFDFKQALGGGLRAYALGSLGEKLGGGPAAGQGTAPTTAVTAPEAATVDVMGGGAPTITTPSGDVSLASSYTGAGGTPIGPQSLSADLTAPLKVGSGYTDIAEAPIYNAPIGPGGGPGTQLTGGSLPPGADTVPGRAATLITPEGQGYGKALTSGTDIAMAGLGGLSIEEAAKEQRNYDIQAAATRREEEERQRRFDELFRRTLGRVPVRSGGQINLAKGGVSYMEAGGTTGPTGEPRVVQGTGDGMSDSVPATIEGVQEARLANDEFVIPADVVSDIGNGSSDAGAKKLYGMMDRIRKARHGTTKQPPEINAESMMPA